MSPLVLVTSTSHVAPFSESRSTELAVPPWVYPRAASVALSACGPLTVSSPSSPAVATATPVAEPATSTAAPTPAIRVRFFISASWKCWALLRMSSTYDARPVRSLSLPVCALWKTGQVHAALWIVVLVATVTAVTALARRGPVPSPLLLTVVGLVASYIPGVPEVELSPEVVLVGFLPPLLYAAALNTSLVDFRRNRRPIALLSVGLVIATTLAVGLVAWWLLPIEPVASRSRSAPWLRRPTRSRRRPSRAGSACRVGWSRSCRARAWSTTPRPWWPCGQPWWRPPAPFRSSRSGWTSWSPPSAASLSGWRVALVTGKLRSRIDDEITDTAVSLVTPFIAYIIAEQIDASGVLAVVVTGLILGHKSHLMQSASSRIFERTNWASIEFLLENAVFLLIGLQVRSILEAAGNSSLGTERIVVACLAVTADRDDRPAALGVPGDLSPAADPQRPRRRPEPALDVPGRRSRGPGCGAPSRWPRPSSSPRTPRSARCWC